ncbi:proliferation marker protein Ki-67 isoform X2 [Apodemus sylvaticus]|uniref:proliferation marker protein Ki-67 isoform X2 n=1 Tax=Apodemus sylvaticus TaxID=10129 RepID=UPI0022419EA8|nr:proliferation marker protein Ki-67 isoform X2 [Apodemus sylvaticus]
MASSARLVTIKRSGDDGAHFPLSLNSCLFGRSIECDIRIQLPVVSKKHCKIEVKEQEAILYNFSSTNPTQVNGAVIDEPVQLRHGDIITIIDRSFRYESGCHENGSRSTEVPRKSLGKEPARRASRNSFCADPGESEGVPLKRRRVSFGGHLKPELFDENLPPNTPLKKGETPAKRKSLGSHSPAVLKKIIKEKPQSPGKQESPGETPPRTNDQRRRSGRTSLASSGNKFLCETDIPKKAGRKSGSLPPKRASISRSQHGILQMICSKRRSGASEANLIVAKSWADVVKLGVKQTQMKVVKQVPQKQASKRQRRPSTPKKPTSSLHNQFSTGHANSPCTIVVGRAQIEKVSVPARPYKMLNNLMLNRKVDFSEDLSGLTEMFKTPVKEKQQQMSDKSSVLSNSENLSEKQLQVTNSGDTPLTTTSEILGEKVFSSTQNAAKQQSDRYSASPSLRRRSIRHENTVQTPNITHLEKKTPVSKTEPLKTASRKSRELIHTLVESVNEKTEAALAESITGRHLKKTFRGQEVDQQAQDSENSSQRCKENGELSEGTEKTSARRSSARKQKSRKDLTGSQMVTQTADCAEELLSQEQGTIQNLEESMHMQNTSASDDQGITKQKVDTVVYATKETRWPKTPSKMTQPLEGPACLKEHFGTPNHKDEPIGDDKIEVPYKSPQPIAENIKSSTKLRTSTSGKKVDMKEGLSALTKLIHMSEETRHTARVECEHGDIKALKKSEREMLAPTVTRSKRPLAKAKEKTQPLEDLTGFRELFLSPVPGDKITKMSSKSPYTKPVRTPASTKRLSKTALREVDVREEPSTLGKRTKSPGRAASTAEPVQEENDTTAFMETPKQKLDFTANSTGHKRRSRTAKIRAQAIEDLDGLQELFKTPAGASDPVTVEESATISLESSQAEPVRTPASTKRLSKAALREVDVREEPSTLGKRTKSPGRAAVTVEPVPEEHDTTAFVKTPKQKLDFSRNSAGSKRRSWTPKNRTQPLEDLDGSQELFQTPAGASDPVTVEESATMSLESSQAEPVRTPANTKRLSKTALREVDVREEPSTLGKRTKSPGRAAGTAEPVQEEHDTTAFMETPKQKLDFTANSTGHKRRSQAPKIRAQPLEDLDGLQELFQTPAGASDPVTVEESATISLESSQAEPVRTPANTKRLSKSALREVDVREEPTTLGKRTKSPGRARDTPAQVQEENDTTAYMETPKQKLEFAGHLTGFRKQSRTPKAKARYLEDSTGFQELSQTPDHANGPLAVDKSKKMSFNSPQPESAVTLKRIERQSRASMSEMDVKELLESEEYLQLGDGIDTLQLPNNNKVITSSRKPAKRKLEPTASMPGSKRMRCSSKGNTPCLEDLSDFQQLFQTPGCAKDSSTTETSMLTGLPQSGPVRTQINRKSLPKVSLRKVDVTEELSVLRKQSLSRAPTAAVQEDNGIKAIMETSKETLKTTADVTRLTRQSGTPKEKVQTLEDHGGFQELFQTPLYSSDPLVGNKRTRMSLKSVQPGFVKTPQTSKRPAKTSVGSIAVREMLSPVHMPQRATREVLHIPIGPEEDDKGNKGVKESTPQTLGSSSRIVSKKQRGIREERSQFSGDLLYLQELFQTPANGKDPVTVGETTKIALQSTKPGHIETPASTKKLSKPSLTKMDVRELPILEKQTQSRGRAKCTPAPMQEDDTTAMETPKQKLDFTASSMKHKRRSQTPKNRTQPLEDLDGFQELFQTPAGASGPVSTEESATISLESSQAEPARTPANTKRLSKAALKEVDVREEPSTLGKRTKSPGRVAGTAEPVQEEHDTTAFMETPKQKLDFTANSTGHKRRSRTAKIRAQPLEDLDGLQELFQTPAGASRPVTIEESATMSLESSQAEPVRIPASTKRLSKAALREVDVRKEPSTPGKRTKSPGRATGTAEPVQEEHDTTAFMETPKQKLDFARNSARSKRRSRTPKNRTQLLEDLDGLQELFQTPAGASDPVTVEESATMSLESSQAEPVRTLASTKRLSKTALREVDVREEPSTLGKRTNSPGRAAVTAKPVQEENDTTAFMETPKQKLDFTANSTGHKRRSRTAKIRAQPLEDLDGLQELFQTPAGASRPVTIEESATMSLESSQAEPVRTPASTKRLSKAALREVDVREEPSTPGKRTKSPGRATGTAEPVQEEHDTTAFMETPKQKLDFARNSARSKRRSRTPKNRTLLLEDLDGLQELFQTPAGASDPVTVEESATISLESSQTEPVRTLASTKRLSKTALREVDVREEPSTLGKRTKSPGRATGTAKPVQEENDTTAFMETPKQKLDFTANSIGHKRRRSRTAKIRAQPLENLDGFQELFQTPAGASDPVTVEESATMSLESSQAEPVRTPASTKRLSKAPLREVDVREEPSTPGKRTKSPGKAAGTAEPVQEEHDTIAFMETPKQKLDFARISARSKRRSRTPKNRTQPLEDLDGLQELFQTPAGASDPVTVEQSATMSLESSQAEPVRTLASTKRLSKTALREVDMRGTHSPLSKPRCASQKVTPTLPADHGRETKNVKVFLAQTLDSAVHVTRGKRQQGSYKKRSQSPESLFGLQELLQTSGHYKDSVTLNNPAKLPGRAPSPEPIDISVTSQRQLRSGLRKVHVKNELSGGIMHPQMSGEIVDLSREPEGEDKVIKTRKQSVKRKLDIAVNMPGSKRQRITRAEKTLEDLPGSQEVYQAPSLVMDSVIVDKTTEMLSKSPEPVDTTSETQPRSRLRRLGVTEEPIPQSKTTRVLRQTRKTHKEPVGESKNIKEFKESLAQKQTPAISLTVRRNQPRTGKKTQSLRELTSFQEETATRMSSKSPPPEEKQPLSGLNRQLRLQVVKVGVKEEPIAQRKQPSRETRNTLTEPVGDSINVEELKKPTKQKIDPVASVPVSKRPRRVPKEEAQTLELAGLKGLIQTLDHTEESANDKGPTQMACNSLQPEQVDSLQTSPRRPRTRHRKVEADEKPSAVIKTVPTSRQTMRSHKVPEIDDSGTQASKASIKQTLDAVAKVTGSRRQLRTHKDGVQPPEDLGDSKEITQVSNYSEKLTHDTSILKSTLQQKADPVKPLRTCRRVLRASKEDPKEVLVDTRDAAALQSKSNPFLSPKRESARDGSILRTRALRSVAPKQEATDEKPVPKKQRAASSKRHVSPEPAKTKHMKFVSNKLESVEEQVSTIMKTEEMGAKRENPVTPEQKTPQSSRYRKKTNEKQPRSKFNASAEKVGIEKNEKTMKTASQETEPQNPNDGAKKSVSQSNVSGKRTCLRSRGQTETPQPREAEEKTSKSGAEILIKTQKEKGVSGDSDVRCLRSKKTKVTLDSEPKPRVTRGAKKDAKTPKKTQILHGVCFPGVHPTSVQEEQASHLDEDIVYTKKLRTRSRQKNETM